MLVGNINKMTPKDFFLKEKWFYILNDTDIIPLETGDVSRRGDHLPDPPEDFYLSLSYSALKYTINDPIVRYSTRLEALAALFGVVKLETWGDLETCPALCNVIYHSLQSLTDFSKFNHSRKFELSLMMETLEKWKFSN